MLTAECKWGKVATERPVRKLIAPSNWEKVCWFRVEWWKWREVVGSRVCFTNEVKPPSRMWALQETAGSKTTAKSWVWAYHWRKRGKTAHATSCCLTLFTSCRITWSPSGSSELLTALFQSNGGVPPADQMIKGDQRLAVFQTQLEQATLRADLSQRDFHLWPPGSLARPSCSAPYGCPPRRKSTGQGSCSLWSA